MPRLSHSVFATIPENKLIMAVFSHLLEKKDFYRIEGADDLELTPEAQDLVLIWEMSVEIQDGGFNQYFATSEVEVAQAALAAIERVLGERHAIPLKDAIDRLMAQSSSRETPLVTASTMQSMFQTLTPAMPVVEPHDIDEVWIELAEERERNLRQFIRDNQDQFVDTPNEEQLSDWLEEPDEYVDRDFMWDLEEQMEIAMAQSPPENLELGWLQLMLEAAAKLDEDDNLEQCLVVMEECRQRGKYWKMEHSPLYVETLRRYSDALVKQGRTISATTLSLEASRLESG